MTPLSDGRPPLKILFALSDRDRACFFPGAFRLPELPVVCTWMTETELQPENWVSSLELHRPNLLVTAWATPALPEQWLASNDCPLRYVCHTNGTIRKLIPRSFIAGGGLVTNWSTLISPQVAEHALLLALAALRNLGAWSSFFSCAPDQRRIETLETRTLFRRRVGIHGFGSVARSLLPLLRPFDVTIRGFSSGVPSDVLAAEGVTPCASLEALFRNSEVLFECEALTPLSEGSVTPAILEALPVGAIFVNVGRGKIVRDEDLQRAARERGLRLALDVMEHEPLTSDSSYLSVPDAILSPHIGGPTSDYYQECGQFALSNVIQFIKGEPVKGAISLEIYDRST